MRKYTDFFLIIVVIAGSLLFLVSASQQVTDVTEDETSDQVVDFTENLGFMVLGFVFLLIVGTAFIWMVIDLAKR